MAAEAAATSGNAAPSAEGREAFKKSVETTLKSRLFYIPAFDIFGGVAGFYDYGPPGCALKSNILSLWRRHFVLEEGMLEVDCPCLTPEVVLKASGHVDNFSHLMVQDKFTGRSYPADRVLRSYCQEALKKDSNLAPEKVAELNDVIATLHLMPAEELHKKIKEYEIVAPHTKNPLKDPDTFNLMFPTSIGSTGSTGLTTGYLRPETAQGIFVNFKDLYYYNGKKLPFAAAQIGQAFRRELSPRQELLRVREFTLAEIEHFMDPEDKSHPKFRDVADLEFLLFPRDEQHAGESSKALRLGDAVAKGTINSETLGYFIGRVYLFLTWLGIDKDRLRFRQHLQYEMAHYAVDCWDAEIECSYGWIECVGIADRSCYDLKSHSEKSGKALVASVQLPEPREVEKLVIAPSKKDLGLAFKGDHKMVLEALMAMSEGEALEMKSTLESNGESVFHVHSLDKVVTITNKMVSIVKEKKKEHQRVFTPSVVEPSFGIGRILYCICEHCFYTRAEKTEDGPLHVLGFPPLVAPIKCAVIPLVRNEDFNAIVRGIAHALTASRIFCNIDDIETSIGKMYARSDEIGICLTAVVDSTTTVTIRERESRAHVRVGITEVVLIVKRFVDGQSTWEEIQKDYPAAPSASEEF